MTDSETKPISEIELSESTIARIAAAVEAGSRGSGFWVVQCMMTVAATVLLAGALAVCAIGAVAYLRGDAGGVQIAGMSALFALPIAIFLLVQVLFLASIKRGPAN